MELYKKLRPTEFSEMVGQEGSCGMLQNWVDARKVPQAIMFTGPSGCGKTTAARILATAVHCGDMDLTELNCASDARGIDTIRELQSNMHLSPMSGRCRVYILDEAHKLTNDAQNGLLKTLEDTPKRVYFFICTTDPSKIIQTVRTRCTSVAFASVGPEDMQTLLRRTAKEVKFALDDEVEEKIIQVAEGSPRLAMVLLNSILTEENSAKQLEVIIKNDPKKDAFELCRLLISPATKWPAVAALLKGIEGEPESLRHMVLAYATSCMCNPNGKTHGRAYKIIDAFERNFYDSKKAGLVAASYQVICG